MDIKRHLKYHLRWQCGFCVCYPCMWFFSDVLKLPLWGAVVAFQFVGASIFYHIDNWIFNKNNNNNINNEQRK